MKRKIFSRLMLITALMLCTFTASAKEKPEAPVVNNSPAVNAAAPDGDGKEAEEQTLSDRN